MELGAGGTLCKLLEEGHEIYWNVFSTAESSLPEGMPKDTLRKEFMAVAHQAGVDESHYTIYDFKVRYLFASRQEILDELVKTRRKIQPDLVVGPSLNDHHQDHQVIANEMVRAFKNTSSIISYELPWNHVNFNMQLFYRLEKKHIEKKIKLLKNYKSQIAINRRYFANEFIKGEARTRGVQVNSDYAEAFEVIRWIS